MASVLLLPGDGIGPEVTHAARQVLEVVRPDIEYTERLVGLASLHATGAPYGPDLMEEARRHDAVLLGAVGGEQNPEEDFDVRPEAALFALRKELELYANLRPLRSHPALVERSPLRSERVEGADVLLVRELTGGLYFGPKERSREHALDTLAYSRSEIHRVVRLAFELARSRRGRLASVDKANVLSTGRLWREVVTELSSDYGDIEVEHLLVDNAAIQLLLRAQSFDVIVTENTFGDILSDEGSLLAGGIGVLPSASIGAEAPSLYEPVHGSAPDIAGKGIANPCAAILSAAMLLRHALDDDDMATTVEAAVDATITSGTLTTDLGGSASTAVFAETVIAFLG